MRTLLVLIFASVGFTTTVLAQNYTLVVVIDSFPGKFTTDYLGNVFHYTSGGISRFDSEGIKTGIFSSREFGDVSSVDATNPMKILVVFDKFSKAVVLDNSMSANTSFDLSLPGIPAFSLICTSHEGGFWIFDPSEKTLKKINDQLVVTATGTSLRQVTETDLMPDRILDSGNWLVLYASGYGFLVFDRYGTYFKSVKTGTSVRDFQVNNDDIIYKEDDIIKMVDIRNNRIKTYLLPSNDQSDACRVESKHIYIQHLNTLKIYSY